MKLAGIMLVAMLVMSGGFYWYYKDSQKTIQALTANNATLTVAVELNEATIVSLQADYALAQSEMVSLNEDFATIRRQNDLLAEKLSENDIGFLAANKPELIERLINNGTENAFRCFEILSGAPLTDKERNAESATDFNNECPWLWNTSGLR
jgi:hypothetical protein